MTITQDSALRLRRPADVEAQGGEAFGFGSAGAGIVWGHRQFDPPPKYLDRRAPYVYPDRQATLHVVGAIHLPRACVRLAKLRREPPMALGGILLRRRMLRDSSWPRLAGLRTAWDSRRGRHSR